MRTLVLAEHDGSSLRAASLSCLAFARGVAEATGGDVAWLVLGHNLEKVVKEAASTLRFSRWIRRRSISRGPNRTPA